MERLYIWDLRALKSDPFEDRSHQRGLLLLVGGYLVYEEVDAIDATDVVDEADVEHILGDQRDHTRMAAN
jgi:hypothetical protein